MMTFWRRFWDREGDFFCTVLHEEDSEWRSFWRAVGGLWPIWTFGIVWAFVILLFGH